MCLVCVLFVWVLVLMFDELIVSFDELSVWCVCDSFVVLCG